MPRAKRSIESTVTIDGISLIWHLHREQQWSTDDGWRGMAIHVRVAEGARRELHMEYPPVKTQKNGYTRIDYPPGLGLWRPKLRPIFGKQWRLDGILIRAASRLCIT